MGVLTDSSKRQSAQHEREPAQHVAIVSPTVAERLLSGKKKIESRFSQTCRAPFGLVRAGDMIYFKITGGQIVARARARSVRELSNLNKSLIIKIRRQFGRQIAADEGYWEKKQAARYGVLVWLGRVSRPKITPKVPRQYGAGWVCLGQ